MEFYKKLLEEINKIRTDPNSFAEKLLGYEQYFEGNFLVLPGSDAKVETQEGFKAYEEAANVLKSTDPLPELSPSKGLGKIAGDFFKEIKETYPNNFGDIDLNPLIKKYGSFSGVFENIIEFGNDNPELIVTNCIVCDGNPEREKRNILLSKYLLKVVMAFGTHVTYRYYTIIISCTEFKNVDNSDDTEVYDGTGSPLPTLPPIESNQKEIKINMEYLSQIINENIYSNIQPEIKSGIPGIFIIFEKISEYFRIEYNLKKISGDFNHIKYIEEKEEDIKKLKQFIEKETLIPSIFMYNKSLLRLICNDLFLYIIFKYKILDKNYTNYNNLFSLIKNLFEIEFSVEEKIEEESLNIFYSLFYFLFVLDKEIYHLIDIYIYLSIKFKEKNILSEDEFYDLFINIFSEIKNLYKNQDLLSIYLFIESIFQILNRKSIENMEIISLFKIIVPELIRLNENLNLNGREIYILLN